MKYAHPYTKTAQGVLMDWSDDLPRDAFVALDNALSLATDAAKDVEAERDAAVARAEKLREALARADERSFDHVEGSDALRVKVGRLAYANGLRDALAIIESREPADDAERGDGS